MTDEQKVREQFEEYVIREHECSPDDLKWDEARNCYAMWVIHFAYQAWKAQAALSHDNATAEEGSVGREAVPARYEYRQRFLRSNDWTEWEECSREMYESVMSNWYANDHVREARVSYTPPPRAAEDAPSITLDRVDADGTEHYFVDGIGDFIPSKHALRYAHSLIQSITSEDREMLDQAIAGKRGG